ncbi:MAG: FAD-dependent oxidoreductase, partial [bacterium]
MRTIERHYQLVVIGGGLAGVCAAVTAARMGIRTALVQDRPVLGGNASSEIRVPPVGANQCNFAYSRETGLVEELFLNNLRRNPTWSPEGWNLELESIVRNEPGIDLVLNTAVCEVRTVTHTLNLEGEEEKTVASVKAYCSLSETWHVFHAPC